MNIKKIAAHLFVHNEQLDIVCSTKQIRLSTQTEAQRTENGTLTAPIRPAYHVQPVVLFLFYFEFVRASWAPKCDISK